MENSLMSKTLKEGLGKSIFKQLFYHYSYISQKIFLELVKEQLILCIQAGPYAKIHVKLGAHEEN